MEKLLWLFISVAVVALIDTIAIERWLKPHWLRVGYEKFKDWFKLYQILLFGLWHIVAFLLTDWTFLGCQMFLHLAGVEDLLYALWCPLIKDPDVAFRDFAVYRFWVWRFPKEWPWLGLHTGKWWWMSDPMLMFFGGDRVSFEGLCASCYSAVVIVLSICLYF